MSYHFMYACSFFYSTTLDHELLINFIFFNLQFSSIKKRTSKNLAKIMAELGQD